MNAIRTFFTRSCQCSRLNTFELCFFFFLRDVFVVGKKAVKYEKERERNIVVVVIMIIFVNTRDHRSNNEEEKEELEFFSRKKNFDVYERQGIVIWHILECPLLFFLSFSLSLSFLSLSLYLLLSLPQTHAQII